MVQSRRTGFWSIITASTSRTAEENASKSRKLIDFMQTPRKRALLPKLHSSQLMDFMQTPRKRALLPKLHSSLCHPNTYSTSMSDDIDLMAYPKGEFMKRRDVLKGAALAPFSAALLSASRTAQAGSVRTKGTNMAQAKVANTPSRGAGTGKVPGFAEHLVTSDMDGLGPDLHRRIQGRCHGTICRRPADETDQGGAGHP